MGRIIRTDGLPSSPDLMCLAFFTFCSNASTSLWCEEPPPKGACNYSASGLPRTLSESDPPRAPFSFFTRCYFFFKTRLILLPHFCPLNTVRPVINYRNFRRASQGGLRTFLACAKSMQSL